MNNQAKEIPASKQVYTSIQSVMHEIGLAGGISKDSINNGQKYKFRSIDDVYNALNRFLCKNNLIMLPEVLEHKVEKETTGWLSVLLKIQYTFINTIDNSSHNIVVYGEGKDNSDKATNKAMSMAYKYACFQVFCIPTELSHDTDKDTVPNEPKKAIPKEPTAQNKTDNVATIKTSDKPIVDFMVSNGFGLEKAHEVLEKYKQQHPTNYIDVMRSQLKNPEIIEKLKL
jgi:ERF superfamily